MQNGIRGWVHHPKDVFGNPDFFFKGGRVAVFVDGCFWHGCPQCGHIPKTNADYWKPKIKRNRLRDESVNEALVGGSINVLRFWECEIREALSKCVHRIATEVSSKRQQKRGHPRRP
jgi:DNA mismatch endonuclease Vsr